MSKFLKKIKQVIFETPCNNQLPTDQKKGIVDIQQVQQLLPVKESINSFFNQVTKSIEYREKLAGGNGQLKPMNPIINILTQHISITSNSNNTTNSNNTVDSNNRLSIDKSSKIDNHSRSFTDSSRKLEILQQYQNVGNDYRGSSVKLPDSLKIRSLRRR